MHINVVEMKLSCFVSLFWNRVCELDTCITAMFIRCLFVWAAELLQSKYVEIPRHNKNVMSAWQHDQSQSIASVDCVRPFVLEWFLLISITNKMIFITMGISVQFERIYFSVFISIIVHSMAPIHSHRTKRYWSKYAKVLFSKNCSLMVVDVRLQLAAEFREINHCKAKQKIERLKWAWHMIISCNFHNNDLKSHGTNKTLSGNWFFVSIWSDSTHIFHSLSSINSSQRLQFCRIFLLFIFMKME